MYTVTIFAKNVTGLKATVKCLWLDRGYMATKGYKMSTKVKGSYWVLNFVH